MDIIDEIKKYVEEESKRPTAKYGYEPFLYHFTSVVKYAQQLAEEFGGDKEIITLAAWLHDIGSVVNGREDHHITGAEIAEKKLRELNYPQEKIELVKKCILNHRGSQNNDRKTIEEKIVAEADAMSNFDNLAGIFKAAFVYEGKDQQEATVSVLKKLKNKWEKLHFEKSKEIIKPKYEAVVTLLKNDSFYEKE
jgi:uncharacterized protein